MIAQFQFLNRWQFRRFWQSDLVAQSAKARPKYGAGAKFFPDKIYFFFPPLCAGAFSCLPVDGGDPAGLLHGVMFVGDPVPFATSAARNQEKSVLVLQAK
jgi:hypothetical protein